MSPPPYRRFLHYPAYVVDGPRRRQAVVFLIKNLLSRRAGNVFGRQSGTWYLKRAYAKLLRAGLWRHSLRPCQCDAFSALIESAPIEPDLLIEARRFLRIISIRERKVLSYLKNLAERWALRNEVYARKKFAKSPYVPQLLYTDAARSYFIEELRPGTCSTSTASSSDPAAIDMMLSALESLADLAGQADLDAASYATQLKQDVCASPDFPSHHYPRIHRFAETTRTLGGVPATLAHCDMRADQVLWADDNRFSFLDWEFLRVRSVWFDQLALILNSPGLSVRDMARILPAIVRNYDARAVISMFLLEAAHQGLVSTIRKRNHERFFQVLQAYEHRLLEAGQLLQ